MQKMQHTIYTKYSGRFSQFDLGALKKKEKHGEERVRFSVLLIYRLIYGLFIWIFLDMFPLFQMITVQEEIAQ